MNQALALLRVASLAGFVLLSACASQQPPAVGSVPAATTTATQTGEVGTAKPQTTQPSTPAKLTRWNLKGTIGVRTADDGWSASVNWQQTGRHYTIRLFGPVGMGAVTVVGTPNKATLTNAKKETFTASSPESLLQQHTGASLPISNIYYWIRGIPAPGITSKTAYDQYHRLTALGQQGWVIHYLSYRTVNGMQLPSKIALSNDQLKIKLIISSWYIPAR